MFVDTHCHLSMLIDKEDTHPVTQDDLQAVSNLLTTCQQDNVSHLITISTTRASMWRSIEYAQAFDAVSAAVGLHPCDYSREWKEDIRTLDTILKSPEYASHVSAIGECGLDFHHEGYDADEQRAVFQAQIELALTYDLPIVVHSRKATEEALRVIEPYIQNGIRGVIHCYGGDASLAQEICHTFGMYVGIAGPVTYPKNDSLREAVSTIGIDNILLETDAPFLPPQVIRGKRNHPRHVATVAQRVSDVLALPADVVGERTRANARALFTKASIS